MVRLAYGVVTGRDQRVWDARGRPVPAGAPPGAPVVVGPAAEDPGPAVAELSRLVTAGGVLVTGAGIELGPGFVSARLDGARGDRRDAVLAAIRLLGLDGMARLGERPGVLVALFGAEATKRVGAAAARTIADERWAALQLASSASALLGSEQLEHVLGLGADAAVEPEPHATPSAMAAHLQQVLAPCSSRRRLDLLLDLWVRVAARQEEGRRRVRLRATQARQSRLEELTRRYNAYEDDYAVGYVRAALGREPTVGEAVRWFPQEWHWLQILNRATHNAMAATVLLRTAAAVADHGVADGLARCAGQIRAAADLLDQHEAGRAARRVPGLAGLPARPGCYVRDLARHLDAPAEPYVRQRLARAADYAQVVLKSVHELVRSGSERLRPWARNDLRKWRAAVGYTAERPPADWIQPPVSGDRPPLAQRLTDRPEAAPEELETAGDLLWYGELADALARLNGHARAAIEFQDTVLYADFDPIPEHDLTPGLDTLASALAGAAQLVSLGARPPRRCRDWQELVSGLTGSLEIALALVEPFRLPKPLAAVDGIVVPGTDARVEWARSPRTLAVWASYMGNCIAEPFYVDDAMKGTCVLAALRAPDGTILANAEVQHRRSGWHLAELQARFNTDPDPGLKERLTRWLATLPPPPAERPPAREPLPPPTRERPVSRRADRLFAEVSGPLAEQAGHALADPATASALLTLEALHEARTGTTTRAAGAPASASVPTSAGAPTSARVPASIAGGQGAVPATDVLMALRRLPADRIDRALLNALPEVGLSELWRATGVRPLAVALAALDPELRARFDNLGLLLTDAPLPRSLRKLARHGTIAPARSMELVTRRIRAALGRLARAADPILAGHVTRHADAAFLPPLIVAVTTWPPAQPTVPITAPRETTVPGFPRSDLEDPAGPWLRAFPDAAELGADLDVFWDRIATGGLRVPAAWLGNGGWPALWQRATRPPRQHRRPHAPSGPSLEECSR
ncbi:hypothetical protein SAMN05444920_11936 [Nonomuraea solani]|uniref:Uncharacterized protein n=1 Tax=Nonomuraea solani TaxID=1144553 RepID=A0A1H6EVP0_9ACTN|nr:hypothetical protein [Nonomuraea solani]SEH01106.1 hypothetical protein SAMN05444920_11936 [Nonomuraea solani]